MVTRQDKFPLDELIYEKIEEALKAHSKRFYSSNKMGGNFNRDDVDENLHMRIMDLLRDYSKASRSFMGGSMSENKYKDRIMEVLKGFAKRGGQITMSEAESSKPINLEDIGIPPVSKAVYEDVLMPTVRERANKLKHYMN